MILFDFDFCSTLCCCFACFGAAFPISNFLASSDMFGSFPSMNCCQAETRSLNLRWALAGIKDALAMVPSFNPAPKACIFWMIGRFGERWAEMGSKRRAYVFPFISSCIFAPVRVRYLSKL